MMGTRQRLLTRLREDFGHSPAVLNVVFGFIMAGVEKIVEVEFACPCDSKWNGWFAAACFVLPALVACLMMMAVYKCSSECPKCAYSIIPPLVWEALVFLDGQYFVCAMTDWPGRFVSVDKSYLKWCTPANTTRYSSEELMAQSHRLFILSQGIGFGLLALLFLLLLGHVIMKCPRESDADWTSRTYKSLKEWKDKGC